MFTIKETSGKVLAKSESALISVGREDDNTICLDVESISGYHGVFLHVDGFWLYRDNFSTNGSFINGINLRSGQARLVKNGDLVRLANHTIQCELKAESNVQNNNLIIIKGFEPMCSISLPESSSTMLLDSTLVNTYDGATITFNRSQEGVLSMSTQETVAVNNKPHKGNLTLIDQDQIDVGEYTFLVCSSLLLTRPSRPVIDREYDPRKKMSESGKNSVFGVAKAAEVSGTVKVGDFRAEMSMSQRLATIADDEATQRKKKVENAYAAFGVLVLFTSISFVVFAFSVF